jgi:hypothetical protein
MGQALVLALVAGSGGCGESVGSIKGRLTYKGKPVPFGVVTFTRDDGRPSKVVQTDEQGHYVISRVPVGATNVTVASPPVILSEGRPDDPEVVESVRRAKLRVAIPEKYKDLKQSGLSYTVAPGENTFDITLP